MRLGIDLNIKQVQKLVMTPELIQTIKILQFNIQELQSFVEEQILINPLLEIQDFKNKDQENIIEDEKEALENPTYLEDKKQDEYEQGDIDWKEYIKENYDDISYRQREYPQETKEISFDHYTSNEISLSEHLLFQLQFCEEDDNLLKKIGRYIIESLDSNGYMTLTIDDIARNFCISSSKVAHVLDVIQTFDPPGIAARNLQECLLIQLRQAKIQDLKLEEIICNHLSDIAENRLSYISKALNISMEEVNNYIDIIKKFEPKPGRQFSRGDIRYIIPDVILQKVDNEYVIIINEAASPRLSINQQYRKMLMEAEKESQISKYLTDKLNSALWLIKSIEQRKQTIYNVVRTIISHQYDFFEKGKRHLVPMTLKQVSEEIGIHESTVSRAVNGKYLQCPSGIYELKYFFSSGVSNNQGSGIASVGVKEIIKELINNEDEYKPLSDQYIMEILNKKGMKISRRTVTKYREEMEIPASFKRKRY